jgi:predicted pyridoxine 5'-phosphate oxidase superfamily flavin-nucleotide-binding protein
MSIPCSVGEHDLQEKFGTEKRALAFYNKQVLDFLNPVMREFIARQEMAFVATADAHGECDCTFRAGIPGFVRVLNERQIAYPEYRGNGVMASLGNISKNPHIGLIFIDFTRSTVGLHVNGKARIVDNEQLLEDGDLPADMKEEVQTAGGHHPEQWVFVEVEEAYIHCSKHIPLMKKLDKTIHWGTDDEQCKGGDYFAAKGCPRPWGS